MKKLIISHENDIDGMGSIVLSHLAFEDFDYLLKPSVSTLETDFEELMESGALEAYDAIYITDLALANPALEMVSRDPVLSKKVRIFDHHRSSYDAQLGIYDFTKIEEKRPDGKKTCGTELFYEFLLERGFIERTDILDDFVELTRLEDTWEWKIAGDVGLKAHDLAILFSAIGIEDYVEHMRMKVTSASKNIAISEEEKFAIDQKKKEYEDNLRALWEDTEFFTDEDGLLYGVVLAHYDYRNELAEYIRRQDDKKDISYIIIVSLEKDLNGQKSYRSIDENVDVNLIAARHGGGGHKASAGVGITREQKEKCLTLDKRQKLEYLATSNFTAQN